jgi:hypothetical protein
MISESYLIDMVCSKLIGKNPDIENNNFISIVDMILDRYFNIFEPDKSHTHKSIFGEYCYIYDNINKHLEINFEEYVDISYDMDMQFNLGVCSDDFKYLVSYYMRKKYNISITVIICR